MRLLCINVSGAEMESVTCHSREGRPDASRKEDKTRFRSCSSCHMWSSKTACSNMFKCFFPVDLQALSLQRASNLKRYEAPRRERESMPVAKLISLSENSGLTRLVRKDMSHICTVSDNGRNLNGLDTLPISFLRGSPSCLGCWRRLFFFREVLYLNVLRWPGSLFSSCLLPQIFPELIIPWTLPVCKA